MIVIDTTAVIDALTVIDGAEALRGRLAVEDLHAPHLIDYEAVSVVRGLVLGGHLTEPRALEALADFGDLSIERWSASGPLLRRAFQLRYNLSAYDAAYVTLAEALRCPLVTRDGRMSRAAPSTVDVEVL
jgi:predicted nucleic acid-binding protein